MDFKKKGNTMKPIGFQTGRLDAQYKSCDLSPKNDFSHTLIMGDTGSGKTVSLILPMINERIKQGYGMMIYAYKGHEHKRVKYLAKEAGCLDRVMEIGKPHGHYLNLLSFLDENALNKVIIALGGREGDYFTTSAASLCVMVVNVLRQINRLAQRFGGDTKNIEKIVNVYFSDSNSELQSFTYPVANPSFKIVAEITKSPKNIINFFAGLEELVNNANRVLGICMREQKEADLFEEPRTIYNQRISSAITVLEEIAKKYKDYSIESESGESSGNNGVLQVLNNAIRNIANKDYVNEEDIDIIKALNEKAIIVFDIEGLDSSVHEVLLESVLDKLSRRVKEEDLNPIAIVIDEANRVLGAQTDMHNDILRESKVELIVAVQNEEQMIAKFGKTKWTAVAKNFKNNYDVGRNHQIAYNEAGHFKGNPLLIDANSLDESEYLYSSIEKNRKIFEESFIGGEWLPEQFMVQYDNLSFEKSKMIVIVDENNSKTELEYVGKSIKKLAKAKIEKLEAENIALNQMVEKLHYQRRNLLGGG
jgi:hypothetical protein